MTGSSSTNETANPTTSRSLFAENVVAGLAAGVTGTVIGYPLDLIKTRMQISSKGHKHGCTNTVFQTAASILKNEGARGFFKGLVTPLVSISLISSITFSCYSWLQVKIGAKKGWDIKNAVAGFVCAPVTFPITTVEGLVRTQMQVDNIHKKQFQKGSYHCISTIARIHGPATLFTGTSVTIMRDAAYLCSYFYVYEGMKATLTGKGFSNDYFTVGPEIAVPLAGGTSGAMAWLASIPFDCVRAGVHSQNLEITSSNPNRRTGRQVCRELIKTRGIRALYRGVTPTVMRAFIVSASRFSAYEVVLSIFRRQHDDIE